MNAMRQLTQWTAQMRQRPSWQAPVRAPAIIERRESVSHGHCLVMRLAYVHKQEPEPEPETVERDGRTITLCPPRASGLPWHLLDDGCEA